MTKTILLLDGANLMQRARFSSRRNLGDRDNAIVYAFFRSLRPLVEKFNPSKIVLALEGRPVKRLQAHEGYKATRVFDSSDNYGEQRKKILDLMQNMPIEVVRHPEREADDVIGHYALSGDWDRRVIVSSDTDFLQLLNEDSRCELYNPVAKKFREPPCDDYVGWKALVGDHSDNIEGFKGVGNKTALKLLDSPEKLQQFLSDKDGNGKYELNRKLIQFEHLDESDVEVSRGTTNWDSLRDAFRDLGFWSMVNNTAWTKYTTTFKGVLND